MEEKSVYQINNEPTPEIKKNKLDINNFYFTNKGYEELQVNFVRIKSICDHYTAFF